MSKTPTVLTTEETNRILNAIKHPDGPCSLYANSFRNFLLTLFMLEAGLRVSEVIQLRRHMISHNNRPLDVLLVEASIAKNHRSRAIPVSTKLKNEIQILIDNVWIHAPESLTFYCFHTGDPKKHITARRIQQVIHKAGMATIARPVWPHVFRHTFATRLMRVTSTRVVQELLGHKNLTSTQIYTHPNSQDLLKAINGMEGT